MQTNDFTLLVITGMGVAPYSARGLKQTLDPIPESSKIERDVNGHAIDMSIPLMRKYRSKITCTDQNVPAVSGKWPGSVVTVDCVEELAYLTASGSPERTVVSSRVEGDFTFYRPRLVMVIFNFSLDLDEFGHVNGWSLDLEEQ